MTGILFTLGVLALAVFGVWAWSVRSHADDLAAWDTLETTFEVMDRSLTPLGHSEAPPCEDEQDGSLTRTYPPSTGPQAAAVIGYLTQLGWSQQTRVRQLRRRPVGARPAHQGQRWSRPDDHGQRAGPQPPRRLRRRPQPGVEGRLPRTLTTLTEPVRLWRRPTPQATWWE